MLVYFILLFVIIFGQELIKIKFISKRTYCIIVCVCMVAISGFRAESVGMYDTQTIYVPSYRIISSTPLTYIFSLQDSQFHALGYVLYCKMLSYISDSSNFFIFMTSWPFFVAASWLINKYVNNPRRSFLSLLALNYLTYSFSMVRGMLAYAFLLLALDAAFEEKWIKYLIFVLIASCFHATSLAFLIIFLIKQVNWTFAKMVVISLILLILQGSIAIIWNGFVSKFVAVFISNYQYYGDKGGEFAHVLIIVYLSIPIVLFLHRWIIGAKSSGIKLNNGVLKIPRKLRNSNPQNLLQKKDKYVNLILGMSIVACVCIALTFVLSEMIRIAMIFGLGGILLAGYEDDRIRNRNNKIFFLLVNMLEGAIFVIYLIFASLPNMNSIPYLFYWN